MELVTAVWVIAIVVLGMLILAVLNNRRLRKGPQLPEQDRYELQASLLDAIKKASPNQHTVVDIRPFWQKQGIRAAQRNAIIAPLVENGDVTIHQQQRSGVGLFLHDVWELAFLSPPTKLTLTDQTWLRMVHAGLTGTSIVIERIEKVGSMSWQHAEEGAIISQSPVTSAGRDATVAVGPSVSSGRDATVSAGGLSQERQSATAGIPADTLWKLIEALRSDARDIPSQEEKARVRRLADKLEAEVEEEQPDADALEDSVARAGRFVSSAGGLMKATASIMEAIQKLRGRE